MNDTPETTVSPSTRHRTHAPIWLPVLMRSGYDAVRDNLLPFIGILTTAALLVVVFYWWPAFRDSVTRLAEFKAQYGIVGSALAAAVAGGLLPEIARTLFGRTKPVTRREQFISIAFELTFFAVIGLIVDRLYVGLTFLYGGEPSVGTAVKKMLTDQFVFTPLVAIPLTLLAYRWRELGFDGRSLRRELSWDFVARRFLPMALPNWFYWIPMNLLTYGLPTAAQFLLYLGALAAWSLLLVVLAAERGRDTHDPLEAVAAP
ncbi:MAG: hypothetical protein QM770_11965 [Tepidisphaeraceae bacterium]